MASKTKIGAEYSRFDLSLVQGQNGYNKGDIATFLKTADAYFKEINRATGGTAKMAETIDELTGETHKFIYVLKEMEQIAQKTIDKTRAQRSSFYDDVAYINRLNTGAQPNAIPIESARMLVTNKEFKGAKAQNLAIQEINALGGEIIRTPNTANREAYTVSIPVLSSDLASMTKKDIGNAVRLSTPLANIASSTEQRARTVKEKEKEAQEEERRQIQEDKESKRVLKGRMLKVIGILTTIADITRRILTATLSMASDTKKQAIEARNLGSTYEAVRAYNYSDMAMGLPEGTTLGALQSIQKMFGNTANIDTNALKWLAMVMGNDVSEMVMSGLGGSNPDKLMENIMDAFFRNQQLGIDQYGNQVGQEQARRSLVTLLESVSPDLARVFSRMVEANTYGINAGRIGNYADYVALNKPALGNLNSLSFGVINALGEEVDSISAKFKNLTKILQGELSIALIRIIDKINNLNWGKSKEEKLTDYEKTLQKLSEKKSSLTNEVASEKSDIVSLFKSYGVDIESYDDLFNLANLNPLSLTAEQKEQRKRITQAMLDNPFLSAMINDVGVRQDIISDIDKQLSSNKPEYKAVDWTEENINRKVAQSLYSTKLYTVSPKSTLDKAKLGTEYQDYHTFDELVYPLSYLKKGELGSAIEYMQSVRDNPIYAGKISSTSDWLKRTIELGGKKSPMAKDLIKKLQKFYGKNFTYYDALHTPEAIDLGTLLMLDNPQVRTFWDAVDYSGAFNKDTATLSAEVLRTLRLNNLPLTSVLDATTTRDVSGMYRIVLEVQQDGKSTIISSDPVDLAGEFQTKLKYDTANKSMQETSKNGKINLNK